MSSTASKALFFILGAASASLITYKVVEKKFKIIADEEIASVKEMYERKMKKVEVDMSKYEVTPETTQDAVKTLVDNNINLNPYSSLVNTLEYSNNKEEEDMTDESDIQVIPPEDFGEYGYATTSLTYYKDKILAYDNDDKVTDVDKIVGSDALNTFGEYEDDSVFVRNHRIKTDFEILLDTRKYSDVVGTDVDDDE